MANPERESILADAREKIIADRWNKIVRPIVAMGIYDKRQIKYAVRIVAGEDIPESQIAPTLTWARKNGHLPSGYKDTDKAIKKDVLTEEENEDRVIRVVARKMLLNVSEEPEEIEGKIDKSLHILKRLLAREALIGDAIHIAKLDGEEAENPVVRFAQELIGAGMIGEDLSNHHDLSEIFKQKDTKLLALAYGIVFESFIVAKKEALRGKNTDLLSRYIQLRSSLFLDEEKSKEISALTRLEGVLGGLGMSNEYVHKMGFFYRLDEDGNRFSTLVDDEIDTPDGRIKRGLSKLRAEVGQREGKTELWDLENPLDSKKY